MAGKKTNDNSPDQAAAIAQAAAGGVGNVDKIRDILFGGQMRDYDRRFSRIDERISEESARLRDNMDARFKDLEQFVRDEVQKLGDKLQQERKERAEAESGIDDDIKALERGMNDRVTDLDDQVAKDLMDLRNKLRDEAHDLDELLRSRTEQLELAMQRDHDHLSDDKVSREDLAGLFTEVSMRLNRQFDLPAGLADDLGTEENDD